MINPFVRSYYNYDGDAASDETALVCPEDTLTVQSEKEDADINTIVRRFGLIGQLPQNLRAPMFEDFDEVFDFRSAMDAVRMAEESFMQLPADVRLRFRNDPQEFVAFCSEVDQKPDGSSVLKNLDEMRKLGLAVPAPVEPVVEKADGGTE